MRKYLMTALAAVALGAAFTSCSHSDDLYNPANEERNDLTVQEAIELAQSAYAATFEKTFGKDVNWGFGSTQAGTRGTRANAGEDYPATHDYANMNHNEWADPDTHFGGWNVPDALTEGQKARVKAYFQANPNLSYEDPEWRHFFVQQVYKGKSSVGDNSPETITAADGSVYDSDNMNLLSVGQSNIHINDFNDGDCGESDVLNNGQKVGGTTHKDKITLMVNIDDTSCFGYHETGSSTQHNNKAALVSAATIDAWAATHGNPGEAVTDKWERSFLGFDLAIKEGAEAYARDESGKVLYATYDQAAESPKYAWDGEKMIEIADPTKYYPVEYYDAYKTIQNIGWLTTNENFYVAADKVSMSQTISMNSAQASTITTIQNAPVLKDVMVGDTYYQSVINLPRINQLISEGYLPVKDKSLADWVKVGKSDGYFTDWIVTLTKAERITPDNTTYRVIAEDLNENETGNDFDFNDVIFDVIPDENPTTGTTIRLLAAGGIYKLTVAGEEVHAKFGYGDYENGKYPMINTNAAGGVQTNTTPEFHISTVINTAADVDKIVVKVYKPGFEEAGAELKAPQGLAASKILVDSSYNPLVERSLITNFYPHFSEYVSGNNAYSRGEKKWWIND